MLLALVIVYTWGIYTVFTSQDKGGNDFFSRYMDWRALVLEGRNPYSDQVAEEIQVILMGRQATLPGDDQAGLIYPWYAVLVQLPFIFFPWPWARAMYMVFCQVCIVIGLGLTAHMLKWKLSPAAFALTSVWAILFYPEARGIILGQIVITEYLFGVLTVWLMHTRRDGWAGVCLVLATVKPTPVFLFVPFILLYALARRRWRVIVASGATLAVLILVGFIILPTWVSDWLRQIARYPEYTVGQSPIWLLTNQATQLGDVWTWLLSAVCVGWMLWAWIVALRDREGAAFHWAMGVTFVVSDLIVYRSATTNYIFLLFPIYLIFAALAHAWPRAGVWLIVALQGIGLVGLWWLFVATVEGTQEQPIMFVPQVAVVGLALLLGQRWLIEHNRQAGVTL